jgi:pimeloyl-ACP methyl ester carboxylesterase
MDRFRKLGFDVVAYDSRANGESEGDACTYGFHEKEDLREVLNSIEKGPVILLGSSLGAAGALQLAASDQRITAVVAAETFSDLRTVVTERAPFFFTQDAPSLLSDHPQPHYPCSRPFSSFAFAVNSSQSARPRLIPADSQNPAVALNEPVR